MESNHILHLLFYCCSYLSVL